MAGIRRVFGWFEWRSWCETCGTAPFVLLVPMFPSHVFWPRYAGIVTPISLSINMRGPPLVHLNLVYEMLVRSPLKAFPKHHQPQMYTFLGVTSDQCFDLFVFLSAWKAPNAQVPETGRLCLTFSCDWHFNEDFWNFRRAIHLMLGEKTGSSDSHRFKKECFRWRIRDVHNLWICTKQSGW